MDGSTARAGDAVTLGIRPEHLTLDEGGGIVVTTTFAETLGHATYIYAAYAGAALTFQVSGSLHPRAGEALTLRIPAAQAYLFDADGMAFSRLRRAPPPVGDRETARR